ncbi:MAG: molybdopterin-dependent oxidoreductase [Thermoleophilia bacterium]|nr:molybdopterin-dependent oxidoreductase [Thermoleophilia bacterium]
MNRWEFSYGGCKVWKHVLDKRHRTWFVLATFALGVLFRLQVRRHPSFRSLIAKKDLVAQIRLADGSAGRYYLFRGGRVLSKRGFHPSPDVVMSFWDPATAARLLRPRRDRLEFLNAARNHQVEISGPDQLVSCFSQALCEVFVAGLTYGTKLHGGVVRYTNNTNGGPVFVYVKNGKILRITPITFDNKDPAPWTIRARGKIFAPPRKTTVSPHTLAWKSLIYSPDRILYPLKRVDFDPSGERNPQNRGISGYERISWDEALDLVASEIKRVKSQYGPGAIMSSAGSHHNWGIIGYWLSARLRFLNSIGWTPVVSNPDSWEGWFWGAVHHWGQTGRLGGAETYGTVEDCLKNAELIVFWSSDPEATSGVYGAQEGTIRRSWLGELGIPTVHIDPYLNHTAAWMGGKWLAPRPGTDSALILAIAYVWIAEGLYDQEYVAKNTVGFEKWKAYVLGESDGIPKTPEWQEEKTGVPAREVRALARQWGTRRTYLAPGGFVGFGGACRTATGTDWARGLVCLMAMQGLGKPGVNLGCLQQGTPLDTRFYFPGYAEGGMSGELELTALPVQLYQRMPQLISVNTVAQAIPRLKLPEAIFEGHAEGYVSDPKAIDRQFLTFGYPAPGCAPVRMYYKYGGSHFGTMVEANRYARMYRSPELEFVVNQSIWFEGEAKFADVILPACTNFERWDIGEFANAGGIAEHSFTQCNHRVIVLQHKCIEPLGESKSDFQIFLELAERLGLSTVFSEGSDELDWCRRVYEATDLAKAVSWKELLKKGYYVVPPPEEERRDPVSFRWFAEGRLKDTPELAPVPAEYTEEWRRGLQTQSGKIEFEASSLKRFDPEDDERPPIMTYRDSWEGPAAKELFERYPLQLVSPHPRFSFHTHHDGKGSAVNEISDHRMQVNGRYYWVARLNPQDAAVRGIRTGDLIRLYNDRGGVICAARVTERVRPGVVHSYASSAVYEPLGTPGESDDQGGCVNILTPSRMMIRRSHSMAANSCLIEVEKWRAT